MALLANPLPALDDAEGAGVPPDLPPIVDAHVHLFPDPLWESIWQWFETYAWPIRYRMDNAGIADFLLSRGVDHVVALQYAHRPGIARSLNQQLASFCGDQPRVTGTATVFPGEEDATNILEQGFDLGLSAVKLHLHVQGVAVESPDMQPIYACCQAAGRPLVMHAGREPKSPAYPRDVYELCSAGMVERVLRDFPRLKLCIPHLGADEYEAYGRLVQEYDTLWLDTAMVIGDYFPYPTPWELVKIRPDRVMYGTDFPNIPYAWDRELKRLLSQEMDEDTLEWILGRTARVLYGLIEEP